MGKARKYCSYPNCNMDTRFPSRPGVQDVSFFHFPGRIHQPARCRKWVEACKRENFTICNVTRQTYLCSKHFVGGNGPTKENPDPISATISKELMAKLTKPPRRILRRENVHNHSASQSNNNPPSFSTNICEEPTQNLVVDRSTELSLQENDAMDFVDDTNHVGTVQNVVQNPHQPESESNNNPSPSTTNILEKTSQNAIVECTPELTLQENDTIMDIVNDANHCSIQQPSSPEVNMEENQMIINTSPESTFRSVLNEENEQSQWLPKNWSRIMTSKDSMVCYEMINDFVVKKVTIDGDGTYSVQVLRKNCDAAILCKANISILNSINDVKFVLEELSKLPICAGNSEFNYLNQRAATDVPELYEFCSATQTSRARTCQRVLVGKGTRCSECARLRKIMKNRAMREGVVKKKKQLCHLTHQQLLETARSQQKLLKSNLAKLERARNTFQRKLQSGIHMSGQDSSAYLRVLEDNLGDLGENDLVKLMLHEQIKACKTKSDSGIRWHPTILKIAAYLHSKSSSCYEAMRKSGLMKLPSISTINRHGVNFQHGQGFHEAVLEHMVETSKLHSLPDCDKYFALAVDEMSIRSNVVFDKHSGDIIGFTEMNSIEGDLQSLSRDHLTELPPVATHVLALFVRGITTNFKYAFAHFPTATLTGEALFPIVWEAVSKLESYGFKILCIVADGAAPNRKFFELSAAESPHRGMNLYALDENRPIFFIADLPHAVKTVRNQFFSSTLSCEPRRMWRRDKDVVFDHLLRSHRSMVGTEYRINWKLKDDDVYLTSFSKMHVGRAFRAMSNSTAAEIELIVGEEAKETCNFIRNINRFSDCLNGHHFGEGTRKRNPDLLPYTSVQDSRLTWLTDVFLDDIMKWKDEVTARSGFTKGEKEKMFLCAQTQQTLKLCVLGMTDTIKFLLDKGVQYVMPAALNQDVLEQEFGRQRNCMGNNENPTVLQFGQNCKKLNCVRKFATTPKTGNTTVR